MSMRRVCPARLKSLEDTLEQSAAISVNGHGFFLINQRQGAAIKIKEEGRMIGRSALTFRQSSGIILYTYS